MATLKKKSLPSFTILIASLILLMGFGGFAFLEFDRTKNDLVKMMDEQGFVLLDALMTTSQRSILAFQEIENQLQGNLLSTARLLAFLETKQRLEQAKLDSLTGLLGNYRIEIYDLKGRLLYLHSGGGQSGMISNDTMPEFIQPILKGEREELVAGFQEESYRREPQYIAAVSRPEGGALVLIAETRQPLQLRLQLGPGKLIQEIGSHPGVEYVVLQDSLGILMASRAITSISSIDSDDFLQLLLSRGDPSSRFLDYGGSRVREICGRFIFEQGSSVIYRIGLSLNPYTEMLKKTRLRLALLVLIFAAAGILAFSLVSVRHNIRTLSTLFNRVKTHTGNILENLEDGVIATDGVGHITICNKAAAEMLAFDPGDIIGKKCSDLDSQFSSLLQRSLTEKKPLERIKQKYLIEGMTRVLSMRTSLVYDGKGGLDSVILVATDLTQESNLEDEMRRKEKLSAMGELASGVAHEIRNPINAIGMIGQRFLKEFTPRQDEEEFQQLARTMIDETRRTHDIIERFLRFAAPPSLKPARQHIGTLMDECASIFKSSAAAAGIEFNLHVMNPDAELMVDSDQMKQALLNLLKNSLEAMEKGSVELKGEINGDIYQITITDTGTGIDPAIKDKIFDIYFTTKDSGTGMGLPIVYRIIQAHGGKIRLEDNPQGGTIVQIRLPLEGDNE